MLQRPARRRVALAGAASSIPPRHTPLNRPYGHAGGGHSGRCAAATVSCVACGDDHAPEPAGFRPRSRRCQVTAQVVPLRVKEAGGAVSPVWTAWKPMPTDAPGAMVALWDTFLAVTRPEAGA